MTSRRASFKVAPGVSISAARPSPEGSRASIAHLERAQKATALESQLLELAAIEDSLVSLHLEEFPAAAPVHVVPPTIFDPGELSQQWHAEIVKKRGYLGRAARHTLLAEVNQAALTEAARVNGANHEEYAHRLAGAAEDWRRLHSHEPGMVIAVLDRAFADNASEATCVDAATDAARHYATVVIVVGSASAIPERTLSLTPAGKPTTKKRTKTDRNALYIKALGSTVLVTVKEAFAVAPQLDEVRVLVLRRDPEAATPAEFLTAIYQAEFDRDRTTALPWRLLDPGEQLLAADNAHFQRKGVAGNVMAIQLDDPDTVHLVSTFTQALRTRPVGKLAE